MNEEEIRAKAKWLSEMYAAKASGEVLQLKDGTTKKWIDHPHNYGPTLQSDMSNWRVKSEPRRMWRQLDVNGEFTVAETFCEGIAISWKSAGHTVTEWLEVLP